MTTQELLVLIVLIVAVGYVAYRLYKWFICLNSSSNGCDSCGTDCPLNSKNREKSKKNKKK